jgi:hypothetical protein
MSCTGFHTLVPLIATDVMMYVCCVLQYLRTILGYV